jgi:hypothetical protein
MAKNKIIAGDFNGCRIKLVDIDYLCLEESFANGSSMNIKSYELITDEHTKSAASGISRGLIGGALLGPVGLLAGVLSASNKSVYVLAIQYILFGKPNEIKKSLIEVDDKIYKAIVSACF